MDDTAWTSPSLAEYLNQHTDVPEWFSEYGPDRAVHTRNRGLVVHRFPTVKALMLRLVTGTEVSGNHLPTMVPQLIDTIVRRNNRYITPTFIRMAFGSLAGEAREGADARDVHGSTGGVRAVED